MNGSHQDRQPGILDNQSTQPIRANVRWVVREWQNGGQNLPGRGSISPYTRITIFSQVNHEAQKHSERRPTTTTTATTLSDPSTHILTLKQQILRVK